MYAFRTYDAEGVGEGGDDEVSDGQVHKEGIPRVAQVFVEVDGQQGRQVT